jgi:hypothetical protein
MKVTEAETHIISFSRLLTLNVRNIPFVNHVKYVGVNFDNRITWRMHIEMVEAKFFRTFVRICFLFKSKLSNSSVKQ